MKKVFLPVLMLLVLASCGGKKNSSTTEIIKDTAITKPVVADNSQKVIYQNAIYYTGRVEFHFKDAAGADVVVYISNMPEDSGAVYPGYLLESTDTLEGIPGANPAMIGKSFLLVKNTAGEVREIKATN